MKCSGSGSISKNYREKRGCSKDIQKEALWSQYVRIGKGAVFCRYCVLIVITFFKSYLTGIRST